MITDTYARAFVTVADPDAALLLDGTAGGPGGGDAGARDEPGLRPPAARPLGVHRLTGNQPFGIIVYAFDDFVSYAFTGGLNLEKE
ncbi:MAG: hypothetical protein R3F43_09250 [bacterium]